jgi:hypothetical protein
MLIFSHCAEESIIEPDFGCLQKTPDEMVFWSVEKVRSLLPTPQAQFYLSVVGSVVFSRESSSWRNVCQPTSKRRAVRNSPPRVGSAYS